MDRAQFPPAVPCLAGAFILDWKMLKAVIDEVGFNALPADLRKEYKPHASESGKYELDVDGMKPLAGRMPPSSSARIRPSQTCGR